MCIDIFTKKKTCSWGTPSPKSTNIVRCAFSKSQEGPGQPLWVRPHAQSSIFGPSQCPLFVPVFAHNQSSRKLEESAKQWQMLARDFCIMNVFQEWSKTMDQWMKMIENAWNACVSLYECKLLSRGGFRNRDEMDDIRLEWRWMECMPCYESLPDHCKTPDCAFSSSKRIAASMLRSCPCAREQMPGCNQSSRLHISHCRSRITSKQSLNLYVPLRGLEAALQVFVFFLQNPAIAITEGERCPVWKSMNKLIMRVSNLKRSNLLYILWIGCWYAFSIAIAVNKVFTVLLKQPESQRPAWFPPHTQLFAACISTIQRLWLE